MSTDPEYHEIEHKFITRDDFDLPDFRRRAQALRPSGTTELRVEDTYFISGIDEAVIFRHRYDSERQELTIKSRGPGDTEVRREVNLRLDQATGNQRNAVTAFLSPFQIRWSGTLIKDICVFYYPDCEVVYYAAQADERRVCCVEFEAIGKKTLEDARATLAHYEQHFGLDDAQRVQESLFDLLLLPAMNAELQRG